MGLERIELPTSPLSGVRSKPTELQTRAIQIVRALRARVSPCLSLKEVIQPQVPLGLPCYDFTPVMNHTVVSALPERLDYLLLVQPTPMV